MIADADGNLKVLGEVGKKKHEKSVSDYCGSCTMYHTGNATGNDGPTGFLMKGKYKPKYYNESYFMREGCALGSSLHMTKNAFMAEAACEEMTPSMVRGVRGMPVIRDNPEW